MEKLTLTSGTRYEITGSQRFDELIIEKDVSFKAPDGKLLTMTVCGIELPAVEGCYKDVVLTLTDSFPSPVDGYKTSNYRTAMYIDNNNLIEEKSVLSAINGGKYTNKELIGAKIVSENDCFNGAVITGGEYLIKDLHANMTGYGENDFCGKGATILAAGDAKVVVDGAKLENKGMLRPTILAGDDAEILVKNSDIMVYNGPDSDADRLKASGGNAVMTEVPWVLGLTGNSRATNIVSRASITYENSTIRAEGWGALSTDGVDTPKNKGEYAVRLTARDCLVEITGEHGYGSYSIGACRNIFDNCVFNIPDYALIVANEIASGEFINNTVVNSGRFGVMWHQNQGGILAVKDSRFNTGMATFLAKACYPTIEVENSVLKPENGVIIQLMDIDDPGIGADSVVVDQSVAVKDDTHDNTIINKQNINMLGQTYEDYCTDMTASFKNMDISGDFYNSTTNACPVGMVIPDVAEGGSNTPPGAPPEGANGEFVPPPPSTNSPVNLVLSFEKVNLTGVISASTARHAVSVITPSNRTEIGQVENTVCPAVNNGVIVTLDAGSKWTVTGDSYLTSLTIKAGAELIGANGAKVIMTVDGTIVPIVPGSYTGNIQIEVM